MDKDAIVASLEAEVAALRGKVADLEKKVEADAALWNRLAALLS